MLGAVLGCGSSRQNVERTPKPVEDSELPVQEEEEPQYGDIRLKDYKIVIGDVLLINVRGEQECTGEFVVSNGGRIDFCYLGSVTVEGKSPNALRNELTERLARDYINSPTVVVDLKKFKAQADNVRVLGAVVKPGTYALKSGYTVLDAILDAGGFTEFASPNRTKVVRGEGGKRAVIVVKMKDVMTSGDREKDTALQAGDMIVVPEAIF